jgi:hypothetical protein
MIRRRPEVLQRAVFEHIRASGARVTAPLNEA